ncbi:MAG TPA: thiamine biosynthesis protein [Cyanobacteria bacterium UBA8803]|nr:thiamine biosynthesis protein [Cyanobacteria bacterium UBA9273]HBL60200.1 thiamine biosynthesis protein [Cyanobacteria bacterium UBA8803]
MLKLSSLVRLFCLAILSLVLTIACTQQPNTTNSSNTNAPQSQPLVSATNNWVGYSGHHVAVGKNFFAEQGLKVKDLFFQSATEQITAFLAGKLDLAWFTSGDAVQMIAKDPSIKIIYLIDYSDGSDGILGRGIKEPQDAKGKTVARENILFERVLLQAYLQKAGLTEKDVEIKDLASADAATAFAAKNVDIAVTYEPYMSKAAKQGEGEIIFSTKGTNLVADVIVARDSLIQSRKADLQAYFRAVDKAVDLLNASDPEALKISGAKLGVTGDEIKAQLLGAKLFDLEGNKSVGFNKNNSNNLMGNLELTAKGAYEFKMVTQPLKVETLYDDSIVQSM